MEQTAPFPVIEHQRAVFPEGVTLDCGAVLRPLSVAYRTYGTLNAARSNAVLVCHALTGDQYVAERQPLTGRGGWWEALVGPGKPVDTDRFFVICANVLGGCMGSTGPGEEMTDENGVPQGRPWGTDFPSVTICDMVRAQKKLVEKLGVDRLLAVIGGSMSGMQVLEWAATYPEAVFAAAPIAAATHHSAQNIAFHEVGRAAIHSDPDWKGGRYWEDGRIPAQGLSVARMVAHITYLSEAALTRKFGRRLQGASAVTFLEDVFQVESYLRHQGSTFVRRFDANSYLTITRAMDYFDLANEHGSVTAAFANTPTRFFVASFSSDWLFPTSESRALVRALNAAAAPVSFIEIPTDKGHDAFLLDEPEFHRAMGGFLAGAARALGV
ncbi:homoserine O-acetyltransferase MetX [Roseococcus pinisoli]|uniref:Homoserine O-acetyltransferase n=1 Tax=Roseococcus pinisoli TaxID=2835040 RepID=A0ABS5Q8Y7_9PROT|nr:homoserine O-acetyltransferase [Roseococcus pinisoli]MBS7810169.1 homoserine O-acetyltransferase [Roseococcus pinisoli]